MKRSLAVVAVVLAFALLAGFAQAADKDAKKAGKGAKNQMVRGTIKVVDVEKNVLIVNQKVKSAVVDRELDIRNDTEFVVMDGKDEQTASGAEGLKLLKGKEGASVTVKCDKDVNVLKVTVKFKKK
jgi:hypothetical protein